MSCDQFTANLKGFVLRTDTNTASCLRCRVIKAKDELNTSHHESECIHHQSKRHFIGELEVTLLPGCPEGGGGPGNKGQGNGGAANNEPPTKRSRYDGRGREPTGLCKRCTNNMANKILFPCNCICLCHECFEAIPIRADHPLICPGSSSLETCGEKAHSFLTVPLGIHCTSA